MIPITRNLSIEDGELEFSFARSGGPGGQNVNKVNSKVHLSWNLRTSPSLTDEQRALLLDRLAGKLTDDGRIVITSAEDRSQLRNRETAVLRLINILKTAMAPIRVRRPTAPTKGSERRRINDKKMNSVRKKDRRSTGDS